MESFFALFLLFLFFVLLLKVVIGTVEFVWNNAFLILIIIVTIALLG
jgi:hypothetical protein